MRTLINIPDADIRRLDELAAKGKRSRPAEIRAAVARHLRAQADKSWISVGGGYWKDRDDIGDGVAYQQAIREDREPFD